MTMTGSCFRVARKPLRISTCSSTVDKRESWLSLALPQIPATAPGTPSSLPSQGFPMPLQVAKAVKGTRNLPHAGRALTTSLGPEQNFPLPGTHLSGFWACTS